MPAGVLYLCIYTHIYIERERALRIHRYTHIYKVSKEGGKEEGRIKGRRKGLERRTEETEGRRKENKQ
jgi:hypothetical protein